MIRNYLKIAWRNLRRNKVYSLINILGLSLGLSCAMLILLYVKDEVSFDMFHENVNNIYRVTQEKTINGKLHKNGNSGYLQGPRFKQNVAGIESFVRIQGGAEDIKKDGAIYSQKVLRVDSTFFSIFSFPLLEGNPKTCLKNPNSIIVSEDFAEKQFGRLNVYGETVMIRQDSIFTPFKVTAIAKNSPQNSSIQFDVLLPFKVSVEDANNDLNWYSYFLNTFVVLNPYSDKTDIEEQMQAFYEKDASGAFKSMIERYGGGQDATMGSYLLQPYSTLHLDTERPAQNGLSNAGNPMYSYILSGIALFVLIIACINFINLTIARSIKRAKEIGIRKVVGGDRKQLIIQFLGESFLLCFMAFAMAIIVVLLVLPVFNELSNKALSFSYLLDFRLILAYLGLFLFTALSAGFYPALVLSKYNPVEILYSRFNIGGKNYLQRFLVVLQFSLASFLIIATFTIYRQFNYLTNADLGYDDSNIISISKGYISKDKAKLFKNELLTDVNIVSVAPNNVGHLWTMAKLANEEEINFSYAVIDESYFPELKIPIVKGRNFSPDHPMDASKNIMVNQAFVEKANWENPIGQTVNFFYNQNEIYQVIGVIKDYHFLSLNQKIEPQLFTMISNISFDNFDIKIKPNSATQSLKHIEESFKKIFPLSPYSYVFKDDVNKEAYQAEAKWRKILLFGALLTIFISCIGLFGLTVLSSEKRTKEIGIRKVLGASVSDVMNILSLDFLKLVAIALAIAIPIAWMASNTWLENYPYRIDIGWKMFVITATLVVIIALITVAFQAIKTALANPINSLRNE
ncbi:ABC transporter permease [Galbibacter marinus]|nr:ABC transporter permease [Galbibacter marinus]